MSTAVFCLAKTDSQAIAILNRLRAQGFSTHDISLLYPDKTGSRNLAHESHTKAPEGATAGAGVGGILGGAVGWLVGIGTLAIPGVGPFVAAGPLLAALSGAAVGAAAGGTTGALIGMGIPEYEAKLYEGRLKEGNILISVHTNGKDEVKQAKEIFEQLAAESIATASEVSVKS